MQSVLHREIGDFRCCGIGFFAHVLVEHGIYAVEHCQEGRILLKFLQAVERQPVEEDDRVFLAFVPEFVVDVFEEVAGAAVPAPPEVVRKHFEGMEP